MGRRSFEHNGDVRLSSLNSCVIEMVRLRCADTKICHILNIKELPHHARLAQRGVAFLEVSNGVVHINPNEVSGRAHSRGCEQSCVPCT